MDNGIQPLAVFDNLNEAKNFVTRVREQFNKHACVWECPVFSGSGEGRWRVAPKNVFDNDPEGLAYLGAMNY